MISKKDTIQKTIRFDIGDSQALDIISAKTNRPVSELVAVGLQFLISDNLQWLANGYFQDAQPKAFASLCTWIEMLKKFNSMSDDELENIICFNPYEFRFLNRREYQNSTPQMRQCLWYPALPLDLNQIVTPCISIIPGVFNGAIMAHYTITNSLGAVLEKNNVMLFYGDNYDCIDVNTLMTPVFARYFAFMPVIRQNYVSKIHASVMADKQSSTD